MSTTSIRLCLDCQRQIGLHEGTWSAWDEANIYETCAVTQGPHRPGGMAFTAVNTANTGQREVNWPLIIIGGIIVLLVVLGGGAAASHKQTTTVTDNRDGSHSTTVSDENGSATCTWNADYTKRVCEDN